MALFIICIGKSERSRFNTLKKTIKGWHEFIFYCASSYDLLGSIYDQAKKSDKAIEAYKKGIEVNPKYQRLYYNLGIAQFQE